MSFCSWLNCSCESFEALSEVSIIPGLEHRTQLHSPTKSKDGNNDYDNLVGLSNNHFFPRYKLIRNWRATKPIQPQASHYIEALFFCQLHTKFAGHSCNRPSVIRSGIVPVPQERRTLCATDGFSLRLQLPNKGRLFHFEKTEVWAGDMQSKQRTAQRSPITHGSRFTQRLHTIMRRKKKMFDFVDSKVEGQAPTTIGSSDLVRLGKVIKSCESEIFWLMSRVHGRQKIADVNLHKTTDGGVGRCWQVGSWTGGAVYCTNRFVEPPIQYAYIRLVGGGLYLSHTPYLDTHTSITYILYQFTSTILD